MAIFNWDESYSVGVDEVDCQHMQLLDIINRLDEAISNGSGEEALKTLLGELADYALYHFKTEEEFMRTRESATEHLQTHLSEHREFTAKVHELEGLLDRESSAPAEALLEYLVGWLVNHIMVSDKEMVRLCSGSKEEAQGAAKLPVIDLRAAKERLVAALRESEVRFRNLADSVPLFIWISDADGKRTFFNKAWVNYTGLTFSECQGDGWKKALHPEDAVNYAPTTAADLMPQVREFRLKGAGGSYRWFLERVDARFTDGERAGYVGSCMDITQHKEAEHTLETARDRLEIEVGARTAELTEANQRLEREKQEQQALIERLEEAHNQLLQSEKMASIGQLAAGVAHEINNPVGYVKSNLQTLSRYLADLLRLLDTYAGSQCDTDETKRVKRSIDYEYLRDDVVALVKESLEGVTRVQHIVQDLKEFSHTDSSEWQLADLHKGIDSTLNLVNNEIKYKAEVIRDYDLELPEVECLPRQLNQVFMNMLVNAAQAIEGRGSITIRTSSDGEVVKVAISDSGCGIPKEKITRVFEPFYTTKPVGKGTGLGLSISYGIVKKHHGRIDVESEVGKGTTFTVVLPLKQPAS